MNFILVWLLVTTSLQGVVSYSPPMQTQNECVIFKSKISSIKTTFTKIECVQITMGVAK